MGGNSDFEWCYTAYKLLLCTLSHLSPSIIQNGQMGSCYYPCFTDGTMEILQFGQLAQSPTADSGLQSPSPVFFPLYHAAS